MQNIDIKYNKGFTLIELMVSMSIFMIVMILALGSLVTISNTAKKSRALHHAMDNINFAVESMSRSIRTGREYGCESGGGDCPGGGSSISFISQDGDNTSFGLFDGRLIKCVGGPCVDMTSSDVNVDNLTFFVKGSDPLDGFQPSIYISMSGSVSVKGEQTSFALQTLVSQRSSEE
jgi:prepilin-type N-terminal cleavage/methylation domain-containing protein